jgi:hypothetical protein
MNDYNKRLDNLFDKWEKKSKENNETAAFCRDGLWYKEGQEKKYVDELWDNSPKRVLFLLKDPKENSGDSREWLSGEGKGYEANRRLSNRFLKNLAYWLYGLSSAKDGKTVEFSTITHENLVECFDKTPFAFVESKKQAGTNRVSDKVLWQYIDRYKEFLKEEINILNPNIIVCCGQPQYNFATTELYKNAEIIDDNIRFHKETDKLLIYTYHPCKPGSYKNLYDGIMSLYEKFLEKYPQFKKNKFAKKQMKNRTKFIAVSVIPGFIVFIGVAILTSVCLGIKNKQIITDDKKTVGWGVKSVENDKKIFVLNL